MMNGNPLKSMMQQAPMGNPLSNNPMGVLMQIMSSPNKEQAAMQMLSQVNPQAYQMIQSGANPQQIMQQFGITPQQIQQVQSQFNKR